MLRFCTAFERKQGVERTVNVRVSTGFNFVVVLTHMPSKFRRMKGQKVGRCWVAWRARAALVTDTCG